MALIGALALGGGTASAGPPYWSAAQADAAFSASLLTKRKPTKPPLCIGEGAHIHDPDGRARFRFFLCLTFRVGGTAKLTPIVRWLRADRHPLLLVHAPADLWDNPAAPQPPAGFLRQFWVSAQAYKHLIAVERRYQPRLDARFGSCVGIGSHFHLPVSGSKPHLTLYRNFRCTLALTPPPSPKPKPGEPPTFGLPPTPLRRYLTVNPDGSFTISRSEPSGIWR